MRAKSSKLVQALVQAPPQCLKYVGFSWVPALRSLLPKLDVAGSSPVARSKPLHCKGFLCAVGSRNLFAAGDNSRIIRTYMQNLAK
jgi:hypothetical protein